ncbi:MAG: C1 family peptidase [Eubacteriales bacterium]|nr:C1 family peptidase [Eubacteriales bacterium]
MADVTQKITSKQLERYAKAYAQNPINQATEAAIMGVGIDQSTLNPATVKQHTFLFSDECKQGEPTNQRKSGRCWYFAALNSLRQMVMEKLNVESFEFSETHLYFYDKLEKANTFLENVIKTADRDLLDRETQLIFDATVYDGGYWNYFVPLCKKYGLVPKAAAPESFHSGESYMFTKQMDYRLKRSAMAIRKAKAEGAENKELRKLKDSALEEVYNIAVKSLGHPVTEFNFSYRDKDKKFHRLEKLTPLEFFEQYIGAEELDKRINLISDPRDLYPHGRVLELADARSVYEAAPAGGLNVPIEVLAEAVLASVKDGVPVWYACDVGKDIDRKLGILDKQLFNYDEVLPPIGEFTKAERFACGYSGATHAMNITGVDLDEAGKPLFWKVENSWGDDLGKKGTFSMSHEWFIEYTFEAIVDKKYIPEEYLKGLEEEAITIPPWDNLALSLCNH